MDDMDHMKASRQPIYSSKISNYRDGRSVQEQTQGANPCFPKRKVFYPARRYAGAVYAVVECANWTASQVSMRLFISIVSKCFFCSVTYNGGFRTYYAFYRRPTYYVHDTKQRCHHVSHNDVHHSGAK